MHFVPEQHPSLSEPQSHGTRRNPNLMAETEGVKQLLGALVFGNAVKFSLRLFVVNGLNAGHPYPEWIFIIPGTYSALHENMWM